MKIQVPVTHRVVSETVEIEVPHYVVFEDDYEDGTVNTHIWRAINGLNDVTEVHTVTVRGRLHEARIERIHRLTGQTVGSLKGDGFHTVCSAEVFNREFDRVVEFLAKAKAKI